MKKGLPHTSRESLPFVPNNSRYQVNIPFKRKPGISIKSNAIFKDDIKINCMVWELIWYYWPVCSLSLNAGSIIRLRARRLSTSNPAISGLAEAKRLRFDNESLSVNNLRQSSHYEAWAAIKKYGSILFSACGAICEKKSRRISKGRHPRRCAGVRIKPAKGKKLDSVLRRNEGVRAFLVSVITGSAIYFHFSFSRKWRGEEDRSISSLCRIP